MKRFRVTQLLATGKRVSRGSCDAVDGEAARRKIANYTGLPLEQLTAHEVLPLGPVGSRPLNGEKR